MTEETKATAGASEDVKNQPGQGSKTEGTKPEGKTEQSSEDEILTLSKAEYQKQLQAESDKRVRQAEKTFEKKYEDQLREKIEKEREDAERLARLTSDEREKELFERNKTLLEEKEKKLRQREMKLAAIDVLNDEGLPVTFADQLLGESVDDTHDRIQKFKKAWHEAIDTEVNKRLKGRIPEDGGQKTGETNMNEIIRQGFRKRA